MTEIAIRYRVITYTLVVLLTIAGIMSYIQLPKAEDPGFVVRTARVFALYPGADANQVDNLVTDKLEEKILQIPEVRFTESQSRPGFAQVTVQVQDEYFKMRPIWDDVRRKVADAKIELPRGVIGPFVNDEFDEIFGTILTIRGDGFTYRELEDIANEVRDEILFVPQVAKVEKYGAQEERIFIEYNNAKIAELGISTSLLKGALEARNIVQPGGYLYTNEEEIFIIPSGNFESVHDIEEMTFNVPGQKRVLYLKDFADVKRGYIDPPNNLVNMNGDKAVALAISLKKGSDILDLGKNVKKVIEEMESIYPVGIQFDFIAFQPDEVERKVHDFVLNLLEGVVIVFVMMMIFLGIRTGMVVSTLIPLVILSTFLVMNLSGIGIDQVSLAALVIALGMLVDNAIVISESILTLTAEGKEIKEAAIQSCKELNIPLLSSSLTTCAAFLPIYLAESVAGEYTTPLFYVISIALISSWFLSMTVIPLFCINGLRLRKNQFEEYTNLFYEIYEKVLRFLLRYPKSALAGYVATFFVAVFLMQFVPKDFFPPSDRAMFTLQFEFPAGTKIERNREVIKEIEEYINRELIDEKGILSFASFVGGQAPRFIINYTPGSASPEDTFMILTLHDYKNYQKFSDLVEDYARTHYPELKIISKPTETGPPVDFPIEIRISGKEEKELMRIVETVNQKLYDLGAKTVTNDWRGEAKEFRININQARAQRAGVTSQDIAVSLQTSFSGFETTQYREENKIIPVIVRSSGAERNDIDKLETINIYSQATGASVPLKQVADIKLDWEPSQIRRRNREKSVTVQADTKLHVNAFKVIQQITPWLQQQKAENWPRYDFEFGGMEEESSVSESSILVKTPYAAMAIILMLIMQFNSLRQTTIVMFTIVLSSIGVSLGLLLTGYPFGFMSLLGMISLAGIVINNAILLVDRINIEIHEQGAKLQQAIVSSSIRRLRPIYLTTGTTIGGLLPLWLSGGELFQPMAVVIIFGLAFSTILTLGFVPIAYSLFYRKEIA